MTNPLNPTNLSRPEAFMEERFRKRYRAAVRKLGACEFCLLRETTFGIAHCKGQPERRMGLCNDDGRLPKFRLDDSTLGKLRDAA